MSKLKNTIVGMAAVAGLQFTAGSALAAVISFDQGPSGNRTGVVSYDGNGGPLLGSNISFSSITFEDDDGNSASSLDCQGCILEFSTGANISEGSGPNTLWSFGPGGTFSIEGNAVNASNGELVASGPLLSGSFTGNPSVLRQGPNSLFVNAMGEDGKNPLLLDFFGIDPTTSFTFATTAISLQRTQFAENGGFGPEAGVVNNVTNADIDNESNPVQQPPTAVPEPSELGMFALGLGLLVFGVGYRRRKDYLG